MFGKMLNVDCQLECQDVRYGSTQGGRTLQGSSKRKKATESDCQATAGRIADSGTAAKGTEKGIARDGLGHSRTCLGKCGSEISKIEITEGSGGRCLSIKHGVHRI